MSFLHTLIIIWLAYFISCWLIGVSLFYGLGTACVMSTALALHAVISYAYKSLVVSDRNEALYGYILNRLTAIDTEVDLLVYNVQSLNCDKERHADRIDVPDMNGDYQKCSHCDKKLSGILNWDKTCGRK